MQNLQQELVDLLQHHDHFVVEGQLNKSKIIEAVLKVEPQLLKLLIGNATFKKHFFQDVEDTLVFDKIAFQRFVNNKSFLPDSYTAFKNKIGLTINDGSTDNYITSRNDVSLVWPHKDCVLEGGQTDDDQKRNEIFWNETLAPDSVDRLLSPKAFTNFKLLDKNGEQNVLNLDGNNITLKGNNLLCLASLLNTHRGAIKLIYIDPPYNTGNDSFQYNDSFNHSTWLTFIKNRVEIASELLASDGSIWVNIDDDESHYLKIIMDEVFDRENFIANLIWEKKYTTANDATYFSDNHDHILVYAKNKQSFSLNKLKRTEKMNKAYTNPDNHPKGGWKATPLHAKSGSEKSKGFSFTFANGVVWSPPPGTFPRFSEDKLREMDEADAIWFGKDGKAIPSRKTFLSEMDEYSLTPKTIFTHSEVGHNHEAKDELKSLFRENLFATPKPERLMQRIIHMATKENDFVLDFFVGSGTTAAVAHKMKRKFIAIEQMDYINQVTVPRLQKVIEGEQGGISKDVDWKGGGSFIYAELMTYNQRYIDQIQAAKTKDELITIWKEMEGSANLSYLFDKKTFNERLDAFKTAPIDEMKQYLVEVLDKNQLYVNYSEIEDQQYGVSKEDIALNHQFYKKK